MKSLWQNVKQEAPDELVGAECHRAVPSLTRGRSQGVDCDVLPARVERLGGARFRLTVFPPLPLPRSGDRHADIAALMTRVNQTLEEWIRDCPEEWFWLHRRWPD
jgi:lauroyl/myristoyl acyltransferase